jgi:hypothetical protein
MSIAAYARVCAKNISGNQKIWLADTLAFTTITITSNAISTLTAASAFHRVQPDIDALERLEKTEIQSYGASSKTTHTINMQFSNLAGATAGTLKTFRESLETASPCGMMAIVLDGNKQGWLIGYNPTDLFTRPLRVKSEDAKSGKAPGEAAGNVMIVLECMASERALPFDATNSGTISTEAASFLTNT